MTTKQGAISAEPVTLTEAKAHLRVDASDEDALITQLIVSARTLAEQKAGRAIATATYTLKLDAFPAGEIRLDWAPVASVTQVSYVDTAEATQVLSSTLYTLDAHNEPAWLLPAYGTEWPDTLDTANAVTVTYVAGEGTSAPESAKSWILLHVGHWYKNREAATDRAYSALPFTDGLLSRWKIY